MIIGLTGLKGSGKDTAAAYLIKHHGFERKAFADPLKKSVAKLFDIPFSAVDKYKNDEECRVTLHGDMGSYYDDINWWSSFTFREFLQRYGAESHRDVFGRDFWVDQILPLGEFYSGRKIVIADLRFENEAYRISQLGGYNIRIVRPDSDLQDPHSSETPLDDDFIDGEVQNSGTIDELYKDVERMMDHILIAEANRFAFEGR